MADRWGQFQDADAATDKWSQFPDAVGRGVGGFARRVLSDDTPSTGADMASSALAGLRKGVVSLPGIPGSLEQLGRMGIDFAAPKLGFADPETVKGQVLPTGADYQRADQFGDERLGIGGAGQYYQPQTTAGKYAGTVAEFAPNLVVPGGVAQRVVMNTALPAVASEAAGQMTEGTKYEPAARIAGAIAGPTVPRMAMRAVTPFPSTPERAAQVATLAREGVTDLTAGQVTGSRPLAYAESMARETPFGGGRTAELLESQGRQFSRAALKRIGENADLATPEVMLRARQRIGGEFDRLTSSYDMDFNTATGAPVRNSIAQRLTDAAVEYEQTVPYAAHVPFAANLARDIYDVLLRGHMTGEQYQAWRSRIGNYAWSTQDVQFSRFLRETQNALDDGMAAFMSPADVTAMTAARREWGHLVELRSAMLAAGEETAVGVVKPSHLARADRAANPEGYVEGTGRYADLARAGVAAMSTLPNSGTPARAIAHGGLSAIGAGAGALVGGPPGAAAGAITGVAAPAVGSRVIMSRPAQGYMSNQIMQGPLNALSAGEGRAAQVLTAPAQGTQEDLPRVKTFEDALRLPKGTRFIDPNGNARVR